MKSSEKQAIWILTILNIALIAVLIFGRFLWAGNGISKDEYNRVVASLKSLHANQKTLMQFQLFTEGAKLNPQLEVFNEIGDTLAINNIISKPVLVLRYSELNCQSCVDDMLTEIKEDAIFNATNTLLLAYYSEPAYLYQFKRMNRLELPVFSIQHTGLPPDTLNIPYFFLINSNLQINNVYIPEEGDTDAINTYLAFAAKRLGIYQ
ncbi:MAG: hypothetical protein PHT26_15960 [Lentimicrobiaceae bacterium]|jgi:hypothetical protein|nr:hypothetical protein [Lentimicrobiaceae bacterium]